MTLRNPVTSQRCGRKRVNGEPCQQWPMHGQNVCRLHGGKSPQALAKAEDRMRALVHPAVSSLARQIDQDEFQAVRYVLDWAGFKVAEQVKQDGRIVLEIEYVGQPVIDVQSNGRLHDGRDG